MTSGMGIYFRFVFSQLDLLSPPDPGGEGAEGEGNFPLLQTRAVKGGNHTRHTGSPQGRNLTRYLWYEETSLV